MKKNLLCQQKTTLLLYHILPKTPVLLSRIRAYLSRYLHKSRHRIIEELFITLAEIAFLTRLGANLNPVLDTAATTDPKMSAHKALIAKLLFQSRKVLLLGTGREFFYRRLENIAQSPLRLDKKITYKAVACMLDNNIVTALPVERTQCMFACRTIRQYRLKVTDTGFPRPVFIPPVKNPAQKLSVLLRRNGKICNTGCSRVGLNTRYKL